MYFYTLHAPVQLKTPFLPIRTLSIVRKSDNKLLATLAPDGTLDVFTGYSWDGATPKLKALFVVIGAWDGEWQNDKGRPQLWEPTLVHDILIQMMSLEGHKRFLTWDYKDNDKELLRRMRETGFKYSRIYYLLTRLYDKFSYRRNRK